MPTKPDTAGTTAVVLDALDDHGLLLMTDSALPSVASLVSGEPITGSWWGHPRGRDIFAVVCEMADHADVLIAKLVSGKVTFIHRKHWAAVITIGKAGEAWQMVRLSKESRKVLSAMVDSGHLTSDQMAEQFGGQQKTWSKAVLELEKRLLVWSEQFHSDRGSHAKKIETWTHWGRRIGFRPGKSGPETARHQMEKVLGGLNRQFLADGRLPWQ